MTRAFELFNFAVSIVNPSMSFSVTATINGSAVVFLVDSGSALTILRKDTWEKCKESGQNLRPWNQKRLVGAEGSQLRVFGSAEVTVDIQGEKFQLSVVVIEPLVTEAILGLDLLSQCTVDLLHKQLITGVGHVVTLHCQQQNMKLTADLVDVYRIEADPGGSDATSFMCSNVESSQHIESPQQESNVKLFQQDSLTCHNQEVDDQSVKSSCVFSVKVQDNVRIPSYSEMEILACVNWCTQNLSSCYVLESNLRNSDLFVARALVKGGSSVFIRLLNPTGKPVTLYSGANVATLSEAVEIVDNHKSVNGINLDSGISVSTVSHDIGKELYALEDIFQELVENTSLSDNEKHLLFTLLMDYADIFAVSKDQLGRTDILQHEIVTKNVTPIRQRFRRMSPQQKEEMRTLLNDMLEKEIIKPSNSPWASPIVLVKKKDGTSRFCVDYHQLNTITRKDAYPLPRVEDTLETLSGSQLFSTLDLASGYWQVEVQPKDREKTAFITSEGLYEFNVLPFGLCNGPATFQRLMNILLAGIQWHDCLVYLDDIIVLGRTYDEHLQNLIKVFNRLRDANLKVQLKKCSFCKKEVKFLGHIVSPEGIATDPEKVLKVLQWPTPLNKQELQQFLGFVNYYRRFVKDCAQISRPLYQLTERNRPFNWTIQCQESFEALRRALVSAPVLVFPDCCKAFILDTDASNQGVGAVLSQEHNGEEHVVAYASRSLTKAERRYSVTRKELLAVVTFLNHFRPYLLGRQFKLRTDHGSLVWIRNFKEPEGQLARWLEQLEEFDFEIVHRRGKLHNNADALSRLPCDQDVDALVDQMVATTFLSSTYTFQDLRNQQLEDSLVGPFLRAKEAGNLPTSAHGGPKWRKMIQLWDQLLVKDGILCRLFENVAGTNAVAQLIVPDSLKKEILHGVHEDVGGGHFGVEKTVAKLKERFYWPGHFNDVQSWCATCSKCIARKTTPPHGRAPLQPVKVQYPMEMIAVDIMGPFPQNEHGNCYILVAEDYFTKWLEAWAIPNQEAKTVACKLLNEMFYRFSLPDRLHSDQGRQFESKIIEQLCKLLQIQKTRTTPYHPQGDGLVERANRTILSMLATVVENHKDWESHLRATCMAYNTSIQSTTGYSPFFLMFGRKARIPVDLLCEVGKIAENANDFVSQQGRIMQEAYCQVQSRMGLQQDRQKELYDRKRHGKPFSVGDLVMLYTSVVPRGYCKKLHRPWSGPFKILKKLSDVTYRIQRCQGRRQRLVVHFNRLKLCPSDIREEPSSIAYGSRNDAFVSSAPARLHHLESGLNSETDLMLEDSSDDDDIDENVQGEDDDQLTGRAGDDSVGNDNQLTIASEQSRVLEPVVEEQETESATVSQQSSDEHLSTEVVDVPRRYPSRTHQPPTRYDNYVRW